MKQFPFFQAIAAMAGTIIGAGIFGLPYIFVKAGFWTGVAVLAVITFTMIVIELMIGEITLRTSGQQQLTGYISKYAGKFWGGFASFVLIAAIIGSLTAYFISLGETMSAVLGGNFIVWGIIFYLLGGLLIYFGIQLIKKVEFTLTLIMLVLVFVIFVLSAGRLNPHNFSAFDWTRLLIPYGVILFACSDTVVIPTLRKILERREKLLKKSIIIGSLIPALIYFLFVYFVVGACGQGTTEIATLGLNKIVGNGVLTWSNIFAFFAIATSLLTLGLALKDIFRLDFKIKNFWAWFLTFFPPLLIYFLGAQDFIKILTFVGALGFGLNGAVYIFTFWRARQFGDRQPEYILPKWLAIFASIFLIAIFTGGLIYTVFNII